MTGVKMWQFDSSDHTCTNFWQLFRQETVTSLCDVYAVRDYPNRVASDYAAGSGRKRRGQVTQSYMSS